MGLEKFRWSGVGLEGPRGSRGRPAGSKGSRDRPMRSQGALADLKRQKKYNIIIWDQL